MAFPDDWGTDPDVYLGPFPPKEGRRPLVVTFGGSTSADFEDGATLYRDVPGVDPQARLTAEDNPHIWVNSVYVLNTGAGVLELSFDGVTVHYTLGVGEGWQFLELPHAGIAFRTKSGEADTDYTVLAY